RTLRLRFTRTSADSLRGETSDPSAIPRLESWVGRAADWRGDQRVTTIDGRALGEISDWVSCRIAADGTPGLSLAITDRDGLIHAEAIGLADLAAKTPVSTGHFFETGSIGKSFTAIALLQLVYQGKLDLNAPVSRYLPWFDIQSDFAPFTLHH